MTLSIRLTMRSRKTRLSFEVFSLESPWTLDYVLAPLPPLGIGLSVAARGIGEFISLREAYNVSLKLLLCIELF